jgi:hypothetical protein
LEEAGENLAVEARHRLAEITDGDPDHRAWNGPQAQALQLWNKARNSLRPDAPPADNSPAASIQPPSPQAEVQDCKVAPDCDDLCTCGHERFHHDDGREMGVETNCKARRNGRPCTCKQFEMVEDEEVVEQPPAEPQGDVVEKVAKWLQEFVRRTPAWADLHELERLAWRDSARKLIAEIKPLLALEVRERLEGLERLEPEVEREQQDGRTVDEVLGMVPEPDGRYVPISEVLAALDTPAPSEPEEGSK